VGPCIHYRPRSAGAVPLATLDVVHRLHEDNPFALPSDEEIFMLQEVERQQRTQLMETMRSLPVHMKSTFSSQIQATVVREVGLEHSIRKAEPKKR